MGPLAVGCGIILIGLGAGFFLGTWAFTALIPAFFGVALVILGLLARQDKLRMHVMHAAAAIGLIGVGLPLWRLVKALSAEKYLALTENAIMAFVCLVFVLLCVRSFILARRSRTRAQE